jgi:hypothetical protein
MIPIDFNSVYEALKKQGLFAVFLGLIIFVQYKSYEDLKADNKAQQMEMKRNLDEQIKELKEKLFDCEKQRHEDLIRRIERSMKE